MLVREIFYTVDQNLQILNSHVFANIEPNELSLQFDRIVDKYIDSHLKPSQVGTLEGIDEIQIDIDNLRNIKNIGQVIPLTNGLGVLPSDYRNLLNSRSEVVDCNITQQVPNRIHGDEDLYKVLRNPFTKSTISSPIGRIYGNNIQIYTNNFVVSNVYIDYIRKPISLYQLGATLGYYDNAFLDYDYVDFPEETLKVILDNLRDRLLELVEASRLNSAVQESQDFGKNQ